MADPRIMARRAAANPTLPSRVARATRSTGPVSRNLVARTAPTNPGPTGAPGPVRRTTALSLSATQRNGLGQRSEWSAPALLPMSLTVTTHQPRWDSTVSTVGSVAGS